MPFTVKGKATVAQVCIKRGTKDDSPVGIVIKFEAEDVGPEVAAAALGADSVDDVVRAFFQTEERSAERKSLFYGLKSMVAKGAWENHHKLKVHGMESVRVRKVNAIALKPVSAGKFNATFQVAVDNPPEGFVDTVAEDLHSLVAIHLEHDQDLFEKQAADERETRDAGPAQVAMVIPPGSSLAAMDDLPPAETDKPMSVSEYVKAHAGDDAVREAAHNAVSTAAKATSKAPKPGDTDKALRALSDKAKADKAAKPAKADKSKPIPKIVPRKTDGKAPGKSSSKPSSTKAGRFGKKR